MHEMPLANATNLGTEYGVGLCAYQVRNLCGITYDGV
jgi:hypothetical protein